MLKRGVEYKFLQVEGAFLEKWLSLDSGRL